LTFLLRHPHPSFVIIIAAPATHPATQPRGRPDRKAIRSGSTVTLTIHSVTTMMTSQITEGPLPSDLAALRLLGSTAHGGFDVTLNNLSGTIPASFSRFQSFHGDIGLGGQGGAECAASGRTVCNVWRCPIPPITFVNGTISTSYAHCQGQDDS
jgi:hypothetical protein